MKTIWCDVSHYIRRQIYAIFERINNGQLVTILTTFIVCNSNDHYESIKRKRERVYTL